MTRYPKTLLQFLTMGQLLVALPLLVMAGYGLYLLHDMAQHYRTVVDSVSVFSRLSGEISEDVVHMKKSLKRHEIQFDSNSLEDFSHSRQVWLTDIQALSEVTMLPAELGREIIEQREIEAAAFQSFADKGDFTLLTSVLNELGMRTEKLRDTLQSLIERDRRTMREATQSASADMFIALLLASLASVIAHWTLRRSLARIVERFEHAITALGRGKLQSPIAFEGPDEIRFLGRWLDWLRRRLLSLEASRTQVLRHVSHELKTPLAAMREGTSLLLEQVPGPINAQQEKILGIVRSNVIRLNDLIDGLLRLQLAEHSAERLGHEWLRYDEIIEQVVETHQLIAQEKACRFQLDIKPVEIFAGREAMLTIVHNLLSNALKFSPDGGCIRIVLATDSDQGILDVSDQGPGVPAAERDKLFQPFFRGASARSIPGIGLGLAIAQQFIQALRGKIAVDDAPGGGAHFRVTLPLRAPYLRGMKSATPSKPDSTH